MAGTVRLALLVTACLAAACAQPGRPPVTERSLPPPVAASDTYRVAAGDTLYSIAWRFGLDPVALARANGIRPPYTILVGQQLSLVPTPAPPRTAPARSRPGTPAAAPPVLSGWRAPTGAPLLRGYGDGNRGFDYQLAADHQVSAAAAGEVVYAGSGLGGFRHLVIVKHDAAWLSAYGLDGPVVVREGQSVNSGDLLARSAGSGGSPVLHFEIRRHGQPVDPGSLIRD